MAEYYITQSKMTALLKELASDSGMEVFGPVKKGNDVFISKMDGKTELCLDYFISVNSIKEAIFPRFEPILKYKLRSEGVELAELPPIKPLVVFGGHPCDAASIPLMKDLFSWDYKDHFYLQRLEKVVIITLACVEKDENCFCTSLGGSPHGETGSDILLERVSKDGWQAKIVSEKGKKFIETHLDFFRDTITPEKGIPKLQDKDIPVMFQSDRVKKWIEKNFDHPLWEEVASNCWSCAACTYVCPTCHCFDITDDATMWEGVRTKNWDACTLPFFTKHASGHNPRSQSYERYRQRISHKYSYYIDLFNHVSCTGCGRCSRVCKAGVNILDIVKRIDEESKKGEK
ncbi:MAG: 4Fe-4S dicluster domain-containing protein [Caldisericia bacterium]|nr:4Fe-4S dicluster domain-containing protein [Caldisericia bacterium]